MNSELRKTSPFIDFTVQLSKLSKCKDGSVAAILVAKDFSQIYSIGINGGAMNQEDCLCYNTDGTLPKYKCVHAEQNCLVKNTNSTDSKIMICTKQCCQTCAALIVNSHAKVDEFWYIESFSDNKGLEILEKANIIVRQIIA